MTAIVILNVALIGVVLLVVVGGLGWSVASDRTARSATHRARRPHARHAPRRQTALQS